jgi:hypothetical protein
MNRKETYAELSRIMGEVRKSDDFVLKQARELKLVLYNLQIEHAHITQTNGIDAIAVRLKSIIDGIQGEVTDLINNNRESLGITLANMEKLCSEADVLEQKERELRNLVNALIPELEALYNKGMLSNALEKIFKNIKEI